MGTPVVATDLLEIRRFNNDHGGIVSVAADAAAYADAIRHALDDARNGSRDGSRERRVSVARSNSWSARIAAMGALIDQGLARRQATTSRWEERLRRAYRLARRRAVEAVVAIAAVYLLLFETNLVWWTAAPLKLAAAPAAADAIVVFAGGVGESGQAGGGYQERVKQAIDLYKAGYAPHIVLSSGFVYSFHEAEVMRALALDQGVPAGAVLLEQQAASTHENVVFVKKLLDDRGWTRILLVSSPYNMRRAVLAWRRAAPAVSVVPTPPSQSQFYEHDRGATLQQIRGILWEYAAILEYWRRGWI